MACRQPAGGRIRLAVYLTSAGDIRLPCSSFKTTNNEKQRETTVRETGSY